MTIPTRHLDSWPFAPFEHTGDTFSTKNPGLSAVIAASPTGRCCSNRDFRLPGRWRALSCLWVPLVNRIPKPRHYLVVRRGQPPPVVRIRRLAEVPASHRPLCDPAPTPSSPRPAAVPAGPPSVMRTPRPRPPPPAQPPSDVRPPRPRLASARALTVSCTNPPPRPHRTGRAPSVVRPPAHGSLSQPVASTPLFSR
jgi:hypothetical protein